MPDLTDAEIVAACARAMGYRTKTIDPHGIYIQRDLDLKSDWYHYNPLHDKAQAFDLIERFNISMITMFDKNRFVWALGGPIETEPNLQRAICTCAALAQLAKEKANG